MIIMRSKNCSPLREATPMYRNTPNSTGMGMWLSRGVMNTERPMVRKMRMWVTRCSLRRRRRAGVR